MTYFCVLTVAVGVCMGIVHGEEDWCEVRGLRIPKGETWQEEGQCVQATCQGNNVTTALGCGLLQVDAASGWTLSEEDPTKSYPDCCPRPIPPAIINTNTPQPPQCVEEGVVYQVGQHKDIPGWCGANVCSGDNEWTLSPCGLFATENGWTTIPEDPSKPYPECCAKAVPSSEISQTESISTSNLSDIGITPGIWGKEANNIQDFSPELSNWELSGLPAEGTVEVDLQAPVLKEDLTTVAQEDSEYWILADDSTVQNVRSTFPNDQAGLRRMMLAKGARTTVGGNNIVSSSGTDEPKESLTPEEETAAVQIDTKEDKPSGEKNDLRTAIDDEGAGNTPEVVLALSGKNPENNLGTEGIVQEENLCNESKSSAEDGSKPDEESKQDEYLEVPSKGDNTDGSEESLLWFGIFK